jgi:chromosome segregation ATPase
MATTNIFSELKFCRDESVASIVTHEPQREEIEALRKELATARSVIVELRALIADRDAKIVSLTADVATLKKSVDHLMAQRRSKLRVPEGQGLLFGQSGLVGEAV